ncbi:hypothetical protein AMS68_000226 [Peltaster fructicola]|uniref:General transcription and DNA repair factor IIH subunit TFB5 n=1 Tax=Peltaster fructicola TaxID=286661 RepID=A0A6H0XJ95_9PEZI|nr:hypothetical protein AMS68_000226 [Peltaster fructicola]
MPRAIHGVLVECDPSIKAIIVKIDAEHGNSFIQEDIDDEHVLIKVSKHDELKVLLKEALKDTVREAEESESD